MSAVPVSCTPGTQLIPVEPFVFAPPTDARL